MAQPRCAEQVYQHSLGDLNEPPGILHVRVELCRLKMEAVFVILHDARVALGEHIDQGLQVELVAMKQRPYRHPSTVRREIVVTAEVWSRRRRAACDPHEVDIAVVSIVATATIGVLTVGGTIWNSLQPARVAREARVEDRRATAYVEILKLAESESRYFNARAVNLVIAATEDYEGIESRVDVPAEPSVDSRAGLAAQVGAFASDDVTALFNTWRRRMDQVRGEYQEIGFYWAESLGGHSAVELDRLDPFVNGLLPAERQARTTMADQIAAELRHRRPGRRLLSRRRGVQRRSG